MVIAGDLWVASRSMANKFAAIYRVISESSTVSLAHDAQTRQCSFGAFAMSRKTTISCIMSVCPHGTTRLPLDGFPWSLIFDYFSKICWVNSWLIKIWRDLRVFYMKTYVRLQYLAALFLEWLTKTMYVLYTVNVIKHRVNMYYINNKAWNIRSWQRVWFLTEDTSAFRLRKRRRRVWQNI
jgi:hypothetical protein